MRDIAVQSDSAVGGESHASNCVFVSLEHLLDFHSAREFFVLFKTTVAVAFGVQFEYPEVTFSCSIGCGTSSNYISTVHCLLD